MVTMQDIATAVGVSRQAVSAVLNNSSSSRVSVATRRRILSVARNLQYVSNCAARTLKGAASKTIGIISAVTDMGLTASLNTEITKLLLASGYHVLYNESDFKQQTQETLLQLLARGVDGIIFIAHNTLTDIPKIKQTVPYVFIGESNIDGQRADIKVDAEHGGYLATRHLLAHGHGKAPIMLILPAQQKHLRYVGWQRAHQEAGIELAPEDTIILRQFEGRVQDLLNILRQRSITAIFAFNDYIGAKLIKALSENGIKVPEDIAIIGTDGRSFCEYVSPSLTTVLNPVRPRAELAVQLLLQRIEQKDLQWEPAGHMIKPILHPGESCGCKKEKIELMFRLNTYSLIERNLQANYNIDVFQS